MAAPFSILAWRIPWTEEPGGRRPTGSQTVGYYWVVAAAANRFSRVRPCATPQTAAHQAPPSLGFSSKNTEWAAIAFSNAGKWKVKVKSLSRVRLFSTPWTAACRASPSMGLSRQEHWSGAPLPSPVPCMTSSKLMPGFTCFLCILTAPGLMPDTSSRVSGIEQYDCSYLCDLACLPSNTQCCRRGHHLKGKADHLRWHLAAMVEQWFRAPSGKFSLLKKIFFNTKNILYWGIPNWPYCDSFRWTLKGLSHTYACIHFL